MKLYIAILDTFPDFMVPTLVAHAMLRAHLQFERTEVYRQWLAHSFKKCVVRVNQKEFDKIAKLPLVVFTGESSVQNGEPAAIVVCPVPNEQLPNVLKFAKLWQPKP